MRIMVIWTLLLALLGASCRTVLPARSASADGAGPLSKDVVILLDHSGSMSPQLPAMRRWIREQVEASAGNGDRFCVGLIGDRSFADGLVVPPLEIPRSGRMLPDRRILASAVTWWTRVLEDSLAGLAPAPASDVAGAICQASRLLAPSGRDTRELMILSDLKDNCRVAIDTLAYRLDGVRVTVAFAAHPEGDPLLFAQRMGEWRQRFTALGASEVVFYDVSQSLMAGRVLPVGHRH